MTDFSSVLANSRRISSCLCESLRDLDQDDDAHVAAASGAEARQALAGELEEGAVGGAAGDGEGGLALEGGDVDLVPRAAWAKEMGILRTRWSPLCW